MGPWRAATAGPLLLAALALLQQAAALEPFVPPFDYLISPVGKHKVCSTRRHAAPARAASVLGAARLQRFCTIMDEQPHVGHTQPGPS